MTTRRGEDDDAIVVEEYCLCHTVRQISYDVGHFGFVACVAKCGSPPNKWPR